MAFVRQYEPETTQQLIAELKSGRYQHVFFYLPTWRDSNYDFMGKDFDLKAVDMAMQESQSLMIFKPHANTVIKEVDDLRLTHVRILSAKTDLYPILPYTDVLITDYSSVINDYLLMDKKGVILYLFDYHKFTGERSFYSLMGLSNPLVTWRLNKTRERPFAGFPWKTEMTHSTIVPPHLTSSESNRFRYFHFETVKVLILSLMPTPSPSRFT